MTQKKPFIVKKNSGAAKHECHGEFEYHKRLILPRPGNQCTVAIMEIPPLKTAYPCHYHQAVTEVFYIISGLGKLETPDGDHQVTAGDVIIFPPGPDGAHKIWNASASEPLVYFDCDTVAPADVVHYPHSGKVGMIVNGTPTAYHRNADAVTYYDGE